MKRLGIQQEEIPAHEVIIRSEDKDIVIRNPQVSKVNMMGQDTYQIVGEAIEQARSTEVEISQDDVQTVMEQTGATEEQAKEVISKHNGDLAQAIMELKQ